MKLKGYFKKHGIKQTSWAEDHGISKAVISKYLRGITGLSGKNAMKIQEATDGECTILELLYPDEY